jgi:hypothetical protein
MDNIPMGPSDTPLYPVSPNTGIILVSNLKARTKHQWVMKRWYIFAMEYNSSFKKKEILRFVITWMNLGILC